METIKDILINKLGLGEEYFSQLEKISKKVQLKKKEFLIRCGETCSFIGF